MNTIYYFYRWYIFSLSKISRHLKGCFFYPIMRMNHGLIFLNNKNKYVTKTNCTFSNSIIESPIRIHYMFDCKYNSIRSFGHCRKELLLCTTEIRFIHAWIYVRNDENNVYWYEINDLKIVLRNTIMYDDRMNRL